MITECYYCVVFVCFALNTFFFYWNTWTRKPEFSWIMLKKWLTKERKGNGNQAAPASGDLALEMSETFSIKTKNIENT